MLGSLILKAFKEFNMWKYLNTHCKLQIKAFQEIAARVFVKLSGRVFIKLSKPFWKFSVEACLGSERSYNLFHLSSQVSFESWSILSPSAPFMSTTFCIKHNFYPKLHSKNQYSIQRFKPPLNSIFIAGHKYIFPIQTTQSSTVVVRVQTWDSLLQHNFQAKTQKALQTKANKVSVHKCK